jgi:hypothetical protein
MAAPATVAGAVGALLPFMAEADALHGALMRCADSLAGCTENSDEAAMRKAIVDLMRPTRQSAGRSARNLAGRDRASQGWQAAKYQVLR